MGGCADHDAIQEAVVAFLGIHRLTKVPDGNVFVRLPKAFYTFFAFLGIHRLTKVPDGNLFLRFPKAFYINWIFLSCLFRYIFPNKGSLRILQAGYLDL